MAGPGCICAACGLGAPCSCLQLCARQGQRPPAKHRPFRHSPFTTVHTRCWSRRHVGTTDISPNGPRPYLTTTSYDTRCLLPDARRYRPPAAPSQLRAPACASSCDRPRSPAPAMENTPQKWGITNPISVATPSEKDNMLNDQLVAYLKEQNNFETPEGTDRRCVPLSQNICRHWRRR